MFSTDPISRHACNNVNIPDVMTDHLFSDDFIDINVSISRNETNVITYFTNDNVVLNRILTSEENKQSLK